MTNLPEYSDGFQVYIGLAFPNNNVTFIIH